MRFDFWNGIVGRFFMKGVEEDLIESLCAAETLRIV